MPDKPHWKHGCGGCKLLGHTIGGGRMHDLYVCDQGGLGTTLIARYSDNGPDYYSCQPAYAHAEGHAELFAAKALWEESRNVPSGKPCGCPGGYSTVDGRCTTCNAEPE